MSAFLESDLSRECRSFTRFLVHRPPDEYVLRKYARAHRACEAYESNDPYECWMVRVAAAHPALTHVADAYARIFHPPCVLRRKLVLLLAILETRPPFCHQLSRSGRGGAAGVGVRVVVGVCGFAAALCVGALIFLPARPLFARRAETD